MSNIPVITSVMYDGTQIKVSWTQSADSSVTGYVINVMYDAMYNTGTVLFSATNTTPGSTSIAPLTQSIPLDCGQLDTNVEYFIQVSTLWGTSVGQNETSQLVPLITQLPELTRAYYDGTDLYFEWTPTPQAAQGYMLQAVQGDTYFAEIASPSACSGMIPAMFLPDGGLSSASPCTVFVSAVGNIASSAATGTVTGNSATATLPNSLPALNLINAYYFNNGLTVNWTPLTAAAGVSSYRLAVTSPQGAESFALDIDDVTVGTAEFRFPAGLVAYQEYDLRLMALNDQGAGVSTALIPLITQFATFTSVVYNASTGAIDMSWDGTTTTEVASYLLQIYLTDGTFPASTSVPVGTNSGSVQVPNGLVSTTPCVARISAVSSSGKVWSINPAVSVYVSQPAVNKVCSDGTTVTVSWTPVAAKYYVQPQGYVISLVSAVDGTVSSSQFISGSAASCGSVEIVNNALSYNVQVALVGGISVGPLSTAEQPIVAAPFITSATTDPVTGLTTLNWGAVSGASGYSLNFSSGSAPISVTAASYTLPAALPPDSEQTVTVNGTAGSGTLGIKGPTSSSFSLPVGRPALAAAEYDGANAAASWRPVTGASGYTVTILGTVGTTTSPVGNVQVSAGILSASLPLSALSGTSYSVVVQTNFSGSTDSGPPSAPLALFSPAFFPSQSLAGNYYPYVYPATSLDTVLQADPKTGEAITLYIPDIGSGIALKNLPSVSGAFTLAANTNTSTNAAYPYILSISNTATANNPWSFGAVAPATPAAIRNGLRTDYIAFLTAVETSGAVPWGISYLQQIIGRYLPQTFAEVLYYNYGFTYPDVSAGITLGSADLRPGMVLRVAINPFQTVTGQSVSSWLNGFVGGSVIDYNIGSFTSNSGAWNVGFDAFIGQLVANGALIVDAPDASTSNNMQMGSAEAADLYYPGFRQPFYRLFSPAKLLSATGTGSTTPSANFALAAASNYANLSTASNTLSSNASSVLAYFRGRTVVKLCARIMLNGVETVVPIGTTIGNLLENAGRLPASANVKLQGIELERGLGGAVLDPAASLSASASYRYRLDWGTSMPYGPNWGILAMPLLPGDKVTIL
ncbi:MAG: hypothetical protein ACXWT4_04250 [Methylobacter sp.]